MERITLRIPKQQMEEIRDLVDRGEYANQSEAIRTAVRDELHYHRRIDGRRKEVSARAD